MGNIQREKIKPLSLTKEDIYKVYILNSNKELKKIYNIDCEAYGKSNISFKILAENSLLFKGEMKGVIHASAFLLDKNIFLIYNNTYD
jgi:hypothetical protein